jgi:hypothetical protein
MTFRTPTRRCDRRTNFAGFGTKTRTQFVLQLPERNEAIQPRPGFRPARGAASGPGDDQPDRVGAERDAARDGPRDALA